MQVSGLVRTDGWLIPQALGDSGTARSAVSIGCFAILIALLSRLSVPVPFSPVPATGQTLGVLLAGAFLGSRRGAAAVLFYTGCGVSGLPVFAMGAGPLYLFGPTGGFLVGFVASAWLVGRLAERGLTRRVWSSALVMIAGSLLIHAFGMLWLSVLLGFSGAVRAGLVPFIPGDILKLATAVVIHRMFGRHPGFLPVR